MTFSRGRALTTLLTALFALVVMVLAGPATAGSAAILTSPADYTLPTAGTDIPTKLATPADNGPHPGSQTEWWYVHVTNPATGEVFIAQLFSAPLPLVNTFWYDKNGNKSHLTTATTPPVTTNQPSVCALAGCLKYDATKKAYNLKWSANGVTADLWLNNLKPGVTWGPATYDNQSLYWTVPAATSNVTGWIWPVGSLKPISVDGWRGYHDHNWGNFNLSDQAYAGWEWAVSHEADGSAELLGGVIDSKGDYRSVLADIAPDGTMTACPGTVTHLSNFTKAGLFDYPRTVDTKCATPTPGVDPVRFGVTSPYQVTTPTFLFTESVGTTEPGSLALIEHFRTLLHLGS